MRARIRAGDPHAFEELFNEHSRSVYNHAFRLIGDWVAAEDVVALTFLEAWRLRDKVVEDGGSLRPWLLGVATNVTRNSRRTARRHQAVLDRMPREQVVPDFADVLVGQIDDTRTIAQVRVLLGKLRRHEREVIALCVWAGLDSAAAAEALGVPVGTVRSRLSRARAKLRRLAERAEAPSPGPPAPAPADRTGDARYRKTTREHVALRTRKEAR
ncbi:RNA polymerase sigma factor [Embleya sp. NBC_00896]|uniref:RNA polymerase sigma factor n=1 Tax=Embleya sp. NBC_00896 TaxID=2975961 RepID=UPI002F90A12B|nr:RNA polymerase sigma factor [Embleya sp. NBC_00896]